MMILESGLLFWATMYNFVCKPPPGRTGPAVCLALARWTGWSAGLVSRHVKCCTWEWSGGGCPGPYLGRDGSP